MVSITASFGMIFVDQSFWQSGIAAKPHHSVWGFICGGICWFAVPFVFAYIMCLAYWGMSVDSGTLIFNYDELILDGMYLCLRHSYSVAVESRRQVSLLVSKVFSNSILNYIDIFVCTYIILSLDRSCTLVKGYTYCVIMVATSVKLFISGITGENNY